MNIQQPNEDGGAQGTARPTIAKPSKIVVPMAEGRAWLGGGNMLYLEKYDGCWVPGGLAWGGNVLIVERMRRNCAGGAAATYYVAHSVASIAGQSVLDQPTRVRWRELQRMARDFGGIADPEIRLAAAGNGGEFLEAVWAAGGEGVCAFDLDSPWGQMWACKRLETFYCVVTKAGGGTQSVEISRIAGAKMEDGRWKMDGESLPLQSSILHPPSSLQSAGRVKLGGGKCDRVRVGSIVKIEGMGLTAAGMIREPRVCQDAPGSWLVKY